MSKWIPIGQWSRETIVDTRLQLHYAAMLTVAPAHSLLAHREDYSEDALSWSEADRTMRSEPVEGLTVSLAVDSAEIIVGGGEQPEERFVLTGLSVSESRRRLAGIFQRRLDREIELKLPIEDYGEQMPAHPLDRGEVFAWDEATGSALTDAYANAAAAIAETARREKGASPVRIWPHHFDIACLVTYADGGEARYIGVGFSPGDGTYAEPYFYVNPWPYPDADRELPELPGAATWHREGWTGAVLLVEKLAPGNDQQSQVLAYIRAAIAAEKKLLGVQA